MSLFVLIILMILTWLTMSSRFNLYDLLILLSYFTHSGLSIHWTGDIFLYHVFWSLLFSLFEFHFLGPSVPFQIIHISCREIKTLQSLPSKFAIVPPFQIYFIPLVYLIDFMGPFCYLEQSYFLFIIYGLSSTLECKHHKCENLNELMNVVSLAPCTVIGTFSSF